MFKCLLMYFLTTITDPMKNSKILRYLIIYEQMCKRVTKSVLTIDVHMYKPFTSHCTSVDGFVMELSEAFINN